MSLDTPNHADDPTPLTESLERVCDSFVGRLSPDMFVRRHSPPVLSRESNDNLNVEDLAIGVPLALTNSRSGAVVGEVNVTISSLTFREGSNATILRVRFSTDDVRPDSIEFPEAEALVGLACTAHELCAVPITMLRMTTADPRVAMRMAARPGMRMIGPEFPGDDPDLTNFNHYVRRYGPLLREAIQRASDSANDGDSRISDVLNYHAAQFGVDPRTLAGFGERLTQLLGETTSWSGSTRYN